jgi:hypothetical protein
MNATIIMISQGATALGGATWGAAAAKGGAVPTFLVAGVLAILVMIITHVVLKKRLSIPNKFLMEVVAPSWNEYLQQHERMTKADKEVVDKLYALHVDPNPPGGLPRVSVDKEVLKRLRPRGHESDNLD